MVRIVGIGDYAVSCSPEDKIITYALASCVAVTAYSPAKKAAGMIHILLPSPTANMAVDSGPCYFAVSGIPLLIEKMCSECLCLKNELKIGLFGGADSINGSDVFKLGQKNIQMAKYILKEMGLFCERSETGGTLSRTVELDVATGEIVIRAQPIAI